ncbi:P450-derived glycosyltransferase activator [Kibdelosporangium persicum]|uniref:Glycosyltransferase auxiliary protein n=1 Tax=Kibdelosporangium persicum TaxID=2698649 RepID=A0ABX2F5V4_9PSEU|nr:P450-derived glycosyltransferase activator [Kibdelosporangium persicum]NRN66573.1 glycosyltransferase auxiliary protein [Kibdelosporangium persicum]
MTRNQIDPRLFSDSDLARHLLTVRGVHWMNGDRGVPLALLLRAQGIDPHSLYEAMRGQPALRQSDIDVWVTVSHPAGTAILSDRRLTRRHARDARRRKRIFTLDAATTPKHVLAVDDTTFGLDHDDHDRLHQLTDPVFGPAAVNLRRGQVAGVFAERAGDLGGEFDLMTGFARPGVITALADLIGLPVETRPRFAELVMGTVPVLDALLCPPTLAATRRLIASFDGIKAMLVELLDGRQLADEVLRRVNGTEQSTVDVLSACLLTMVVGTHVASNLICDTVLALHRRPDQWDLVRADPSLAGAAVEETLRYDPPVRIASRIAGEDAEVAGLRVNAGDQVVVLLDGANRDPEVFADPGTFRITRTDPAAHLTLDDLPTRFVAPVVRVLAAEATRALVTGVSRLDMAGDVVRYMRSPVAGSMARCPVKAGG